jgi:arginine exporter protein ArgO
LPLPAGQHTITYVYDPWSFKIGALATAMTWLLALGLTVVDRRRYRAKSEAGSGINQTAAP